MDGNTQSEENFETGVSKKQPMRLIEKIIMAVCIVVGIAAILFALFLMFLYNTDPVLDTPTAPAKSSDTITSNIGGSVSEGEATIPPFTATPIPAPTITGAPNVSVTPAG